MRMAIIARFAVFTSVILFLGAGCISFSSGGGNAGSGSDGGVYKTVNKGDVWTQKNAVASAGTPLTLNGTSVVTMTQDPQDAKTWYLGTLESGLLYSLDAGESWTQVAQLSKGRVPAVAVDSKNKCTIFAAFENKIIKSTDCTRTWNIVYVNDRPTTAISAVLVDFFNPQIIWAANTTGDVLKSADGGASWANLKNFGAPIVQLVLHANDSRKVFAITKSLGMWRTDDGGTNWKALAQGYAGFAGAQAFSAFALTPAAPNTVVFASTYGILRSVDNGDTWSSLPLLTTPGTAAIYSLAIDPRDVNTLYYGTATNFYRTSNGGTNWTPKKLPTSRAATFLVVDRSNSAGVYMGVTKFK